jgi:hypothetical protein
MCRSESGSRITTTTTGDQGFFVAEPPPPGVQPALSKAAAYRHFHRMYGPTTTTQDRHTQIRYGLISDLLQGPQSGNVIGFVPQTRRARAWIISNCTDAPRPRHTGASSSSGSVIFAVADTSSRFSWGWAWWPHRHRNRHPGFVGPNRLIHHPSPSRTPFYSAPWRIESNAKNGSVLLRYTTRHCFTLDHVNVFSNHHGRYSVSVILSGGPNGDCPKPSSTSPFTAIRPDAGPIKEISHEATGLKKYRPDSAG